MTVSRVLNDYAGVSVKTRELVLSAAKQMGYVPNASARSLASGRSHMLGLMIWDMDDGYNTEVTRGVCLEAKLAHYEVVLYLSGKNKEHELSQIASLMGNAVAGLIMVLHRDSSRYLELLTTKRFPFVLIDQRTLENPLPTIRTTNYEGAMQGTRHLIALGHCRIGFITGYMGFFCARERLRGYQDALVEAGILYNPAYVRIGDFDFANALACATELLTMDPRPTAIFASDDTMALGVYTAASTCRLRVPEDVSVVGFDDVPMAARFNPPLTTVRQPIFEMGRQAVLALLAIIQNNETGQEIAALPTELVVRASTAPPR